MLASLPQIVEGDDRAALATVLDARPELAALERELAQAEQRLADPALAGDMGKLERALANQERLLARWGELGGERAGDRGAHATCTRSGSTTTRSRARPAS